MIPSDRAITAMICVLVLVMLVTLAAIGAIP